jgi:predicted DNA-binding transcriptional regulator
LKQNRRGKKKTVPDTDHQHGNPRKSLPEKGVNRDMELYDYIIENGGTLRLPEAMRKLQMSREEIIVSIRRLKESKLLPERNPHG